MNWKELTDVAFKEFKKESKGVAIIPYGCLEKHGYQLPLGTDMYCAEEVSLRAAEIEPALVVPVAPYGIISEATHKEGCLSLSSHLQYEILEEVCDELARNGYHKIIFVSGHGGNTFFLKYFCQSRLERPHPYITYFYESYHRSMEQRRIYDEKFGKFPEGGHADEYETSQMMAIHPDLVHMENIVHSPLQYEERKRENTYLDKGLFTGIWWYSKYPEHFAGDPSAATIEKGNYIMDECVNNLAKVIKFVKDNDEAVELTKEFYAKKNNPEI